MISGLHKPTGSVGSAWINSVTLLIMEPEPKRRRVETPAAGVRQEDTPASRPNRGELLIYVHFRITGSKVKDDDTMFELMDTNPWITEFGYQREKGEKNGIEHYQGTMKVEPRKRVHQVQDWFKEHIPTVEFPAKDYCKRSISEAANRYGMKEDTRIAGPWYKGPIFDKIAKETVYKIDIQLKPWQQKIVKVIENEPDDRLIWWFWEPMGGLGKTTFQKWLFQNYKGVTPISGKAADMKNGVIEYMDANDGRVPKIIIINLPKTHKSDYFSFEGAESIKDMWFYSGKYKGGVVCNRNPHLLIFANVAPNTKNMSPDRWNIIRLPDGKGTREEPLYETWDE